MLKKVEKKPHGAKASFPMVPNHKQNCAALKKQAQKLVRPTALGLVWTSLTYIGLVWPSKRARD